MTNEERIECDRCGGSGRLYHDAVGPYDCPECLPKYADAQWRASIDQRLIALERAQGVDDRAALDRLWRTERDRLTQERDAALRERDEARRSYARLAADANVLVDAEHSKSARLRDAAVRVAAAAKSYDSNREVYPAFMQRVRDLCALVGEEAKT